MENSIFLIKWYGPFKNRTEVQEWEETHKSIKCSLYLLHGKVKYAKTSEKYYCGKSLRNVYERLGDKGHHIKEIEDRLSSIYVGCLSNIKHLIDSQISLAEKIITASLTDIVGENCVLNRTNTYFPDESVFVINEWWKTNAESIWVRLPKNSPSNIVPDVLVYHIKGKDYFELFGCKKLKRLL